MIPRFSLYLDPNEMNGYVREDCQGQWVRWLNVMDYIAYAEAHGFVLQPTEIIGTPPQPEPMVDEDLLPEDLLEEDYLPPDESRDVYDTIMMKQLHYEDD